MWTGRRGVKNLIFCERHKWMTPSAHTSVRMLRQCSSFSTGIIMAGRSQGRTHISPHPDYRMDGSANYVTKVGQVMVFSEATCTCTSLLSSGASARRNTSSDSSLTCGVTTTTFRIWGRHSEDYPIHLSCLSPTACPHVTHIGPVFSYSKVHRRNLINIISNVF